LTDLSIAVQPQNNVLVCIVLVLLQNLLLLVHASCFMGLEAVDALTLELAMGTQAFLHPNVRTLLLQHFQTRLCEKTKV
jgi:hypothetical protein